MASFKKGLEAVTNAAAATESSFPIAFITKFLGTEEMWEPEDWLIPYTQIPLQYIGSVLRFGYNH